MIAVPPARRASLLDHKLDAIKADRLTIILTQLQVFVMIALDVTFDQVADTCLIMLSSDIAKPLAHDKTRYLSRCIENRLDVFEVQICWDQ